MSVLEVIGSIFAIWAMSLYTFMLFKHRASDDQSKMDNYAKSKIDEINCQLQNTSIILEKLSLELSLNKQEIIKMTGTVDEAKKFVNANKLNNTFVTRVRKDIGT